MGLLESSLEVLKLAGKIANPELVQAATKANIEALELSTKNIELQKKAAELEEKVEGLEATIALKGEVFRHSDFVYLKGDPHACCSRCWDDDHKLIHIVHMHHDKRGMSAGCPKCKTSTMNPSPNPRG
jgi:hypothetical protein